MKNLFTYTLCGLLLASPLCVRAQYKPDSSFSNTGCKIFPGSRGGEELGGMQSAPQADGSVVVAGYRGTDSLTVIKLLRDGNLDQSFGNGGYMSVYTTSLEPATLSINILVQRDKKVVVMASGQQITVPYNNSRSSILLARFNANGTPDAGFGNNGLLIDRPDTAYQYFTRIITSDTSGATDKLIVAAFATENGNANCALGFGKWCISRYNADGSRDLSFNGSGYVLQPAADIRGSNTISPMADIYGLKALPGGKLVAAGAFSNFDSALFMFRMNADGSWDKSFGSNGRALMPWKTACSPQMTSGHFLSDNSFVLAVSEDRYTSGAYDSSILYAAKFNNDGSVAGHTFGTNGILKTSYKTEGHHQVSVDAADRMLLSWNEGTAATQQMHFRRFAANGIPDASFGQNGHLVVEPIRNDSISYATIFHAAPTPDSKGLIVVERRFSLSLWGHLGVFRYNVDQKPAPSAVAASLVLLQSVFPVPATDKLIVEISSLKGARFSLVNANGQTVIASQQLNNGINTVNVASLARGVYYLNLTDASGNTAGKKVVLE